MSLGRLYRYGFGLLGIVLVKKVLVVVRVAGESMEPYLRSGDLIVGIGSPDKDNILIRVLLRTLLRRGAVVVFRPPAMPNGYQVKIVSGLAGDIRSWGGSGVDSRIVPAAHVFVVGSATPSDDRQLPQLPVDSRMYGPIALKAVVARMFVRVWPAPRAGWLRTERWPPP